MKHRTGWNQQLLFHRAADAGQGLHLSVTALCQNAAAETDHSDCPGRSVVTRSHRSNWPARPVRQRGDNALFRSRRIETPAHPAVDFLRGVERGRALATDLKPRTGTTRCPRVREHRYRRGVDAKTHQRAGSQGIRQSAGAGFAADQRRDTARPDRRLFGHFGSGLSGQA